MVLFIMTFFPVGQYVSPAVFTVEEEERLLSPEFVFFFFFLFCFGFFVFFFWGGFSRFSY